MHTRTIATTVTTSVVLGQGQYGARLSIAADGKVTPAAYGADAILAPSSVSDARVVNAGIVLGGYGPIGYAGGIGVSLAGAGQVIDLAGIQADDFAYSKGVLTLYDTNHIVLDKLHFSGDYTKSDFALQAAGKGTDVIFAGGDARGEAAHAPDFTWHRMI